MKKIITTAIFLTLIFTATTFGNNRFVGTWIKTNATQEGGAYPHDTNKIWNLEVIFRKDGTFQWNSKYITSSNIIYDCSLSGKYKMKRNSDCVIAFYFDKTTDKNKEKEKNIFSFWPNQSRGEFVFYFKQKELVLSGGPKLHIYFMKKDEIKS